MEKVRYAVVGAGWISQEAFLPAVHAVPNSEVVALVSGNTSSAEKLAAFHDIPQVIGYDGYDDLLASGQIDAVYIALPNSMHADYSIRAAKAGVHALVEKPLAVSIEECNAMIDAAAEADTLLMTAYRLHSEPGTLKVLDLIRSGAIGEPKLFSSTFSFQSGAENHRLLAEHWGGPLQDIGVYCLNAVRHCFGDEPLSVSATKVHGNGDPRFREVEGSMAVTMGFPKDRLAQFVISFETDDTDFFRVIGTEGEVSVEQAYDFHFNPRIWLTNGRERREIEVPDSDHFSGQLAYFSSCIIENKRPIPDGHEGLADVRALLAIEKAALTGEQQILAEQESPRSPDSDCLRVFPRTDRRLVF